MKTKNILKKICFTMMGGAIIAGTATSCTKLDEKVFSDVEAEGYYHNESVLKSAVASTYISAAAGFLEYFWYLQELPSDQLAWRTWNGGAWGWDEGAKYVLSTQSWGSDALIIQQAWEHAWETISLCNLLLTDLNTISPEAIGISEESMASYIAEVRTMRAWAYYNNFEIWGGALPLCTEFSQDLPSSISNDFNEGCDLMWQFISDELDSCYEDMMVEDGAVGTRNRLTQGANRILKMRLLLNSEIWTGENRYDECATLAQEIIDGKYGNYNLVNDYREIYAVNNNTCPEVIFAFAMGVGDGKIFNNNRNTPFLSYEYKDIYDTSTDQSAWDCWIVSPSHDNSGTLSANNDYTTGSKSFVYDYGDKLGAVYDRLNAKDIRRQAFNCDAAGNWQGLFAIGQQYEYGTNTEIKSGQEEMEKKPLYFTDQVGTFTGLGHDLEDVMSPRWGMANSGIRFLRYPIYPQSTGLDWRDASQVEFRLTEAYYTLAECKMRSGDSAGAKELVNQVRKRYYNTADLSEIENPGPGFTAFDMDWMLSEWGLEYIDEGRRRRTDLRRFDKFTQGQWWFFGRAKDEAGGIIPLTRDRKFEWYPLPNQALIVNPNLVQNPNY